MRTIVVAVEKGGLGKSTLSVTLAVIAFLAGSGARVGLLDLDPQGSVTAWWNRRIPEWPFLFSLTGTLAETIKLIEAHGVDLLIIDTAPGYTDLRKEAIKLADLVLVPGAAGVDDLAGIASTVEMAKRAGVPHRIVLNKLAFRTRLAGQAVLAMRQRGDFLGPPVHTRQPILRAMESGRVVTETEPDSPGAVEMTELWDGVHTILISLPKRHPVVRKLPRGTA